MCDGDVGFVLTREQVRRVDRLAMERYGLCGLVLMENAGRNCAAVIERLYGPCGRAVMLCGPGNNGGDGCVIARHLHNAGWCVSLLMTGEKARMSPDTRTNFEIVERMGVTRWIAPDRDAQARIMASLTGDDVVVDALLGTGFRGEVREPTAGLIRAACAARTRASVAVDVPSGLDCDTGAAGGATFRADVTVTFVAMKTGLRAPSARRYVGRIEVVDIGAPRALLADVATGCEGAL
ncbi:MAG: NAD(P)H-hydrate epimerase [Phycisphaerae bacterium]